MLAKKKRSVKEGAGREGHCLAIGVRDREWRKRRHDIKDDWRISGKKGGKQ